MNFEEYLRSKKIDSSAFRQKEPDLWESWRVEFEQISPTSFTAQKLYLINPIRRKYLLPATAVETPATVQEAGAIPSASEQTSNQESPKPPVARPAAVKPVFKPKPKMN